MRLWSCHHCCCRDLSKSYLLRSWLLIMSDVYLSAQMKILKPYLSSKWTYFLRTIPNVKNYLQPLEDTIWYQLLPTLTGQCAFNDELRTLISLPSRLGGLGILNPLSTADSQFNSSLFITGPLVSSIILSSNESILTILADISQRKADIRKDLRLQLSTLAQEL